MKIARKELDDLYNKQRLSIQKIADRLNISEGTVRYWMNRFGISRRSRLEAIRLPLDESEIERLYTIEKLSTYEIAQQLGVSEPTICNRLDARGVKRRDPRLPLDNEEIKRLYTVEQLSLAQIAQQLGVSVESIRQRLEECDIDRRASRLSLDEREIERLYTTEKLSSREIAQQLGVSENTILRRLDQCGVERRCTSGALRAQLDGNDIERLYVVERLTLAVIAQQFGVGQEVIRQRLEERGVERRKLSEANIIYQRHDFSGSPLEKAYLQGFRLGDLHVRMNTEGQNCATIIIS